MTIKFSERVNWNYSKPFLNKTYIQIYIKPFVDKYDEYDVPRNLNLTWEMRNCKNNTLEISLNFS